ncbi:uncharacterized protein LOC144744679 [Ciona intestinalis]
MEIINYFRRLLLRFRLGLKIYGENTEKRINSESEDGFVESLYDLDSRLAYPRAKILWDLEPELVTRFLGISLPDGVTGEDAKMMLRKKRVWPYYYPDPQDPRDYDRFPIELCPEFTGCSRDPYYAAAEVMEKDEAEEDYYKNYDETMPSMTSMHSEKKKKKKKLFSRFKSLGRFVKKRSKKKLNDETTSVLTEPYSNSETYSTYGTSGDTPAP